MVRKGIKRLYAFLIFFALSVVGSILIRRPIKSIFIPIAAHDFGVEVRIADLFDVAGAIMISTNTKFEADVALWVATRHMQQEST